jgi:hypothetical protein
MFDDQFATADGKVKLVSADIIPANERPDDEYPFVLITGPTVRALAYRQYDASRYRTGCH